jgi:hypothetical protein
MANRLAMHKSQGILWLAAAGHSERQIAKTLGVSRGAVRRHLGRDGSKRTKAPTSSGTDTETIGSEQPRSTQSKTTRRGPTGTVWGLPSPVLFQAPADTRRDLHLPTLHSLVRIQRRKNHVPPWPL